MRQSAVARCASTRNDSFPDLRPAGADPKQPVSFLLSSHSAIDALHRLQREQLSHRLPSSNKPGLTIFHQHFGNQRARVVVR